MDRLSSVTKMENQVQQFGVRGHRYQNILASRSFPLLFGIVCFLIIANTRCDSVGTTNVQKFHPNGRYGRRSVNNFVEPSAHVELGKLKGNTGDESSGPLSSFLHTFGSARNGKLEANTRFADLSSYGGDASNEMSDAASMEQELNKLLKCSYTGVSNLYWCGTSN